MGFDFLMKNVQKKGKDKDTRRKVDFFNTIQLYGKLNQNTMKDKAKFLFTGFMKRSSELH